MVTRVCNRLRRVLVSVVIVVLSVALASAQEPRAPHVGDPAAEPLEQPVEAPPSAVASQPKAVASEPTVIERNGFVSVQVNVAAGGLNIEGDAANEPSLAVDPTAPNRMAIGWRQFDTSANSFRQAGVAWTNDGGRTWTFPGSLGPGEFRSDPVLMSDADGWFYYSSLRAEPINRMWCEFFISHDGGKTWSPPVFAFGGDKQWVAVDRTEGIGRGHLYMSWSTSGNQYGRRVFTRSIDAGESFSEPLALTPAPIWGSMIVGPDGGLYIAGNDGFGIDSFVVHRSFDARDPEVEQPSFEWFRLQLGGTQSIGGDPNPEGLLGQVWLDVDRSDGPKRGNLYIAASVDPPGGDPQDVHFVRSIDGGATWSEPVAVNVDSRAAWQWFGTMSVAPNGRIDVVWIESLDAAQPNVGELYYASSSDAGVTWSDAVAITPSFDSTLGWPRQQKMGDYFHMVSDEVGADLAYAATFNGEQDVYSMRIGGYDCNRNGVEDAEDLAAGTAVDCNGNGIPDRCELAAGAARDDNANGRLDVCERPRRTGGRVR